MTATPTPDASLTDLTALSPDALWKAFAEICTIPHPSEHEAALINFVRLRAEKAGLETHIDQVGNLIATKPATKGMETAKGIILQAHVDMVPQANSDTEHDFTTDPIRPRIVNTEGKSWVKATGTTLGADNGIGVATMIAIMEDTALRHGPLEFVFTVEEETGLVGALGMQPGTLKGSILINLDSEEDGAIVISCAGGADVTAKTPIQPTKAPGGMLAFTVKVQGLKGGHSGCDIHLGRGNAILCLTRLLKAASSASNNTLSLAQISGGTARNAIPREAEATFVIPQDSQEEVLRALEETQTQISQELAATDPGFTATCTASSSPKSIISPLETLNTLRALNGCHNGIETLSTTLIGIPVTSSNLGEISTEDTYIKTVHKIRSNINSARDALCERIADSYAAVNSEIILGSAYPGWSPNPQATLPQVLSDIFEEQNGRPATITSIHAGLECAILGAPYPHWEMAAIGPTICNPHSPDECVDIESVERFWNWLIAALEKVPSP